MVLASSLSSSLLSFLAPSASFACPRPPPPFHASGFAGRKRYQRWGTLQYPRLHVRPRIRRIRFTKEGDIGAWTLRSTRMWLMCSHTFRNQLKAYYRYSSSGDAYSSNQNHDTSWLGGRVFCFSNLAKLFSRIGQWSRNPFKLHPRFWGLYTWN